MMMTILKPDVALFVTEHPVWLHSDLQTLVEPGRRKYIRRLRHILINVYICRYIVEVEVVESQCLLQACFVAYVYILYI